MIHLKRFGIGLVAILSFLTALSLLLLFAYGLANAITKYPLLVLGLSVIVCAYFIGGEILK